MLLTIPNLCMLESFVSQTALIIAVIERGCNFSTKRGMLRG